MVTYLLDLVGDKCLEALCIVRDVPNNDFAVGPENPVIRSYSSTWCRTSLILTDTKAAVSSSLGILTGLSGATRDLAIAREQCIWPEWLVNLSTCMDLMKHALCVSHECY